MTDLFDHMAAPATPASAKASQVRSRSRFAALSPREILLFAGAAAGPGGGIQAFAQRVGEPCGIAAAGEPQCAAHDEERHQQFERERQPAGLRMIDALLAQAAIEQRGIETGGQPDRQCQAGMLQLDQRVLAGAGGPGGRRCRSGAPARRSRRGGSAPAGRRTHRVARTPSGHGWPTRRTSRPCRPRRRCAR